MVLVPLARIESGMDLWVRAGLHDNTVKELWISGGNTVL
jgi:hypothetical protein